MNHENVERAREFDEYLNGTVNDFLKRIHGVFHTSMIRRSSYDENKETKYESSKVDFINFYREKAFSVKNFFSKKLEGEILEI